jgi:hypothetical protein
MSELDLGDEGVGGGCIATGKVDVPGIMHRECFDRFFAESRCACESVRGEMRKGKDESDLP